MSDQHRSAYALMDPAGYFVEDVLVAPGASIPPNIVTTRPPAGLHRPRWDVTQQVWVEGDEAGKREAARAVAMARTISEQKRIVAGGFDFRGAWWLRADLNVNTDAFDLVPISTGLEALLELEQITQAVAADNKFPFLLRYQSRPDYGLLCDANGRPMVISVTQLAVALQLARQHLFTAKAIALAHLTALTQSSDPGAIDIAAGWPDTDPETRPEAEPSGDTPPRFPWLTEAAQHGTQFPDAPYPGQAYYHAGDDVTYQWVPVAALWLAREKTLPIGLTGSLAEGRYLEAAGDVKLDDDVGYVEPYPIVFTELVLRWKNRASGTFTLVIAGVDAETIEFTDARQLHAQCYLPIDPWTPLAIRLESASKSLRFCLGHYTYRRLAIMESAPSGLDLDDDDDDD